MNNNSSKENHIHKSNTILDAAPVVATYNRDNQQTNNSNLYSLPHKGIFQPEPNILICKAHCCIKFIGLYIFLYGALFGTIFPAIGIIKHIIVLTVVGFLIFGICVIVAICLSCFLTTEVKFVFSNSVVEIIVSRTCRKNRQIAQKEEIANIIFDYIETPKGVYQSLHIMFKNGIQNDYFGCKSNPPCFTKYEVEYFNNEVKRLLQNEI